MVSERISNYVIRKLRYSILCNLVGKWKFGIRIFGLTLCSVVCSSSCIYIWFMSGEFIIQVDWLL